MTALDESGYQQVLGASQLARKYATPIDRESAHEILAKKLGGGQPPSAVQEKSVLDEVLSSPIAKTVIRTATSQATRTVTNQIVRGIFGMLKGK